MSVIDRIEKLYADYGQASYGEDITQTQHAVQCATLAQRAGAAPELITAALLHDIGHLLEEISKEHGNFRHDRVGADALAADFGPQVSEPVRLHAQAKRYLCTTETGYHDTLSEASKYSLQKQGGLMTAEEVQQFEQQPYFAAAIQLRRWDDHGKDPTIADQDITVFRSVVQQALR